ncbi:site-specific DNA-methyltransferase [uncultured Prevotella sp.]|uniref:DNA-methyltransferase n=1 Tax=uncultured Prevotella sp. TaxID=159272 RepID=UPI0027E3B233|nr:site-specific DNA-methyltransferase [uncultured Prevotella sp.]
MAIRYIPYNTEPLEGQARLDCFARTKRMLYYKDNDKVISRIERGMPIYEVAESETVGKNAEGNIVMHGECLSTCAYLKDKGIEVDLVYIDPPFASGADYAKKIHVRRNPLVQKAITEAEQQLDNSDMMAFEEKMYGDIWDKERYLNWMYENLMAIKAVMSDTASIYVHLDYHIGHYVKILMDEIFGEENFRNEIIWHYYNKMQGNVNRFASNHDSIYFYSKSDVFFYKQIKEKREETVKQIKRIWDKETQKLVNAKDDNGKVIYIETDEKTIDDVWRLSMLQPADKEEPLDYSTQKPEALLERIIKASSNEGMVVADFFGGSGVAAAVAHKLGRKFVHGDANINSIQTARDRLVSAGAEFTMMRVRDGVRLFRNPVQTMDKLASLITGLNTDTSLDKRFWAGSIHDSQKGQMPVYLPNLLDSSSRVMDKTELNHIIREALPDLSNEVKQVIVYYIDVEDMEALCQFIHDENTQTDIEIELRDLKQVLDDVVTEDEATWTLSQVQAELFAKWQLKMLTFHSDYVMKKVLEFNLKGEQQHNKKKADGKKSSFKRIEISDEGLECIEWLSVDCTNAQKDAPWHSDAEVKIEKTGTVTLNGTKTRQPWDCTITSDAKPLRLKVRNICGDETIYIL